MQQPGRDRALPALAFCYREGSGVELACDACDACDASERGPERSERGGRVLEIKNPLPCRQSGSSNKGFSVAASGSVLLNDEQMIVLGEPP